MDECACVCAFVGHTYTHIRKHARSKAETIQWSLGLFDWLVSHFFSKTEAQSCP